MIDKLWKFIALKVWKVWYHILNTILFCIPHASNHTQSLPSLLISLHGNNAITCLDKDTINLICASKAKLCLWPQALFCAASLSAYVTLIDQGVIPGLLSVCPCHILSFSRSLFPLHTNTHTYIRNTSIQNSCKITKRLLSDYSEGLQQKRNGKE